MKPYTQLLFALFSGAVLGLFFHSQYENIFLRNFNDFILFSIGQIFLRLIFMIVVPMVVSALTIGAFELASEGGLGKTAIKTFFLTLVTSSASVIIGVSLVNFFHPGSGNLQALTSSSGNIKSIENNVAQSKPIRDIILDLIPKNPIAAAVKALDGEMVSLMVFALIFGSALGIVYVREKRKTGPVLSLAKETFSICMRIIDGIMKFAPIAVFALVFNVAFKHGHEIFISLAYYVLVVLLGLLLQQFGVYSIMLKFIGKTSPLSFFKKTREVLLYAFATASSNATLPYALEVAEKDLKIPSKISRFVLTVGSTANQNGTALFEGVTVLFLAQVYGIDLSFVQQTTVVLMSVLAGVGTAGVPGGSLPLILILLQQMGIPAEGLGLVLGVDRFLDMCRTSVNVSGDLVIAKCQA
ncbi:MAG: sodium:proton symporter [Proteobacteria bacterium SG_bin7]|nr:MAG: sodium:proton symporter [Proteobacteria bacterium SG_bin7]